METDAGRLFFFNLFTILSHEKGVRLFEKKSVINSAREHGLSREEIVDLLNSWKEGSRRMAIGPTQNDNLVLCCDLCAALISDDSMRDESIAHFLKFAEQCGLPITVMKQVLSGRERFLSEAVISKRAELIRKAVEKGALRGTGRVTQNGVRSDFYIANQVTREGLDEIQRLLLAYQMGINVAIDGPPGVGKTKSIIEISRILGSRLFTKTCSGRTTESHIISYPVLTGQDGVSVTIHVNGPLALAMEEPGIFYGDEFNLLKEDVQKRLNSAFDERRSIDRNDGVQISAKPGFWAAISYNPTENLLSRDLEDSVADRFIHLHYDRWTADFKAYVSSKSAERQDPTKVDDASTFNIKLGWRGIAAGNRFLTGEMKDGTLVWSDFFTFEKVNIQPEYVYRVYDRGSIYRTLGGKDGKELEKMSGSAFSAVELARVLSRFTDMLQTLSRTGKAPMLDKIGLGNILEEEDFELFTLHESSTRIEIAAMKHYHDLVRRGYSRFLAQSYAARLVLDQVCYGQYRDKRLRKMTVYELVMRIAMAMGLLSDNKSFNTRIDLSGILSAQ